MALEWAASFGEISRSAACRASEVFEAVRFPKTLLMRRRSSPCFSSASNTLVKVGGAGSFAIASISVRALGMAAAKAGTKWAGLMVEKGGKPNGVFQVSSRGFIGFTGAADRLTREEARKLRRSMGIKKGAGFGSFQST